MRENSWQEPPPARDQILVSTQSEIFAKKEEKKATVATKTGGGRAIA